ETWTASFWSPSRAPTSTRVTRAGKVMASPRVLDGLAGLGMLQGLEADVAARLHAGPGHFGEVGLGLRAGLCQRGRGGGEVQHAAAVRRPAALHPLRARVDERALGITDLDGHALLR